MKMTDNHNKVDITMTYNEAELLLATVTELLSNSYILEDANGFDLAKDQINILTKLEDKLDEYCNT